MKNMLILLSTLFSVFSFAEMAEKPMSMPEKVRQLPDAYVGGHSSVVRNPTVNINEEEDVNYTRNIHHLRNIYKLNHTHMHKRFNHKVNNHHKMHTKIINQFSQSASADATHSVNDTYETMPTVEVNSQVSTVVGSYYPNLYGSFCHPYYGGRFFRHCRGF